MKAFKIAKSKGQALVYIIALLVPLSMGAAYVYNTFNLSNEKTRLQNTADAVAYSVATIEARDLNFKSYTNRAMVANQVAIAQTIGLVSWTRWLDRTSENLALVTSWIPYANAVTRIIARVANALGQVVERAAPAAVTGLDTLITLLTNSQRAMHIATLAVAADTVREVSRANDPSIQTGLSFSNAALFADYTRKHNRFSRAFRPDTVRSARRNSEPYREHFARVEEFREITMESRDGFSSRRTYRWFSLNLFVVQFAMRRAGGTDLTGQSSRHRYGSWIAMDTMSWHTRTRGCGTFGTRWCRWRETIPVGWGAAKASRQQESISFRHRHNRRRPAVGDSWDRNQNPVASGLAHGEFQGAREIQLGRRGYSGLRNYFDLHYDGLIQKAPGISILLTKPQNSVRDTRDINYNQGNHRSRWLCQYGSQQDGCYVGSGALLRKDK